MTLIDLSVVDCTFRVECDHKNGSLLNSIYYSLRAPAGNARTIYHVTPEPYERISITRNGALAEIASAGADFLYKFDKDLIIETQKLRSDLYFIHGAVLAADGQAIALIAPSGSGKSTTTWGLLHHGFSYLSDELAPIDPKTMRVNTFPRALSLKANPPVTYPLPASPISIGRLTYLRTSSFPCHTITQPLPLKYILFLRSFKEREPPALRPLSKMEATVRLITNALNPLAHPTNGLDAAVEIVSKACCFELVVGDLAATCDLVTSFFRPESGNTSAASLTH